MHTTFREQLRAADDISDVLRAIDAVQTLP
jgi:hypothetical protein